MTLKTVSIVIMQVSIIYCPTFLMILHNIWENKKSTKHDPQRGGNERDNEKMNL